MHSGPEIERGNRGRFPGADEPFVDPVDRDRSLHDMREMSITSRARGAVLMLPGVLYVMACICAFVLRSKTAAVSGLPEHRRLLWSHDGAS